MARAGTVKLPCFDKPVIAVKTAEDAERLKEALEGWVVKHLLLQDRRNWCRYCSSLRRFLCKVRTGSWAYALSVWPPNGAEHEPVCAIIYPPWTVVVELNSTGYAGFLVGEICKLYTELEVMVFPELRGIMIEPKGE